ncbi:MAG: hypothetical protein A2167_01290 [Planctomycetes bacterium RBG_13_46_10]|nr:MAG: hypothetical protein A2167_01290 [Planctomycetes bacterium RBG_13_46_10]
MNKPDTNIDELLNSFIDGELTESQQVDVTRLIEGNPQIQQRLRQFQKTKMLITSSPRIKAPHDLVERIEASLEAGKRLAEQRIYRHERAGVRQLLLRKVLTAAAMIALVAVMGGVIYTILAPGTIPEQPTVTVAASGTGFSGRLELNTAALTAVNAFINGAIEGNGLSDCVTKTGRDNQRFYSLNCSRQELKSLLTDLQSIWQRFDSATLYVDTEQFNQPVAVNAVTAEQTVEIISQDSAKKSVEIAKDFTVLNNMTKLMPGKEVAAAIDDKGVNLLQIPKPVLTGGDRKTTEKTSISPPRHKPEVSLTIVVTGSE